MWLIFSDKLGELGFRWYITRRVLATGRPDHFPFSIFHFSFVIELPVIGIPVTSPLHEGEQMKNEKWKMENECVLTCAIPAPHWRISEGTICAWQSILI
jgi:hypothetical protein